MSDLVTLLKSRTVAIVEINNPPVNALGQAVRKGLLDACLLYTSDAADE